MSSWKVEIPRISTIFHIFLKKKQGDALGHSQERFEKDYSKAEIKVQVKWVVSKGKLTKRTSDFGLTCISSHFGVAKQSVTGMNCTRRTPCNLMINNCL